MLPTSVSIAGYDINTFGVFLLLGFLVLTFIIWQEGTKDGFNEERVFDLLLITTVSTVVFARFGFTLQLGLPFLDTTKHIYQIWTPGMNIYGAFFGALIILVIITKIWKWSTYRVLDIFALAISLGFSVVVLAFVGMQKKFEYLFAFSAWVLLYAVLSKVRSSSLKSGTTFSIFLFLNALLGSWFFRDPKYLILFILLVTLGLANLYLRTRLNVESVLRDEKKLIGAKDKTKMTDETQSNEDTRLLNDNNHLLKKLKRLLVKKDARLEDEENDLQEEDPYMVEGRDVGNSEFEDEANEDIAKLQTDVKLSSIGKMRIQVRKALAKMSLGTYGLCEVCGESIDKARLKVYPEATTCLDHAESE